MTYKTQLQYYIFVMKSILSQLCRLQISWRYLTISKPRRACDHYQISKVWLTPFLTSEGRSLARIWCRSKLGFNLSALAINFISLVGYPYEFGLRSLLSIAAKYGSKICAVRKNITNFTRS